MSSGALFFGVGTAAVLLLGGVGVAMAAVMRTGAAARLQAEPGVPLEPALTPLRAEPPADLAPPEVPASPMDPIDWFGGDTEDNRAALTYLLASENPSASPLVWALQAICANNWARLLASKHPEIRSIADMLQAGLHKPTKTWHFQLGWGPQFDKTSRITRWASTSAGKKGKVSPAISAFAASLLANQMDLRSLKGKKGESMPSPKSWPHITSFLQYAGFSKIVQAQQGDTAEHSPDEAVASWGNPALLADADGVRFYGRGA